MLAHCQTQHGNPNTGLMLVERRGQWANIGPALGQRIVFDRLHDRKLWLTEMNGTDRRTERTKRTNVNQHVPTFVYIQVDINIFTC